MILNLSGNRIGSWLAMYQRLVDYKNIYGTTCVPWNWREDPKFGKSVHKQSYYCKKQQHHLLNSIGFVWKQGTNKIDVKV